MPINLMAAGDSVVEKLMLSSALVISSPFSNYIQFDFSLRASRTRDSCIAEASEIKYFNFLRLNQDNLG